MMFAYNTVDAIIFITQKVTRLRRGRIIKFGNADSLMDIANYPPFHFEHLKGDRKDEWSIRLGKTGYRVTLIPCDNDENEITEGDILAQCKMIKIVKVTEVSNHYE